jgi:hypothetical protein
MLRSEPVGEAAADERRQQVFQAALAQAEELWDAAAAVGPRSRPLPLFYCLSQATRAVCAPWIERGEKHAYWEPAGHGLKTEDPARKVPPPQAVPKMPVSVDQARQNAFPMLAKATLSPMFEGKATVAELWASLPDLPSDSRLTGESRGCLVLKEAPQYTPAANAIALGVTREGLKEAFPHYPTTRGFQHFGEAATPAEQVVGFP